MPSAPDDSVIKSLNYQPEFKKSVWDYLSVLVDAERVRDGLNAYARHKSTVDAVATRYGIDPYHLLGVWGVESNFGQTLGKKDLITSLGTLSCFDRRQSYFQGELLSALKILQHRDIARTDMVGSWAGAFGQTQFMPSTYLELGIDFDGDGRRDLVNSVPDALASTANFLAKKAIAKARYGVMKCACLPIIVASLGAPINNLCKHGQGRASLLPMAHPYLAPIHRWGFYCLLAKMDLHF